MFASIAVLIYFCIAVSLSSPIDSAFSYIVKDLPGLEKIPPDDIPIMHSGHLELYPNNNTNYFFWKFHRKESNTNKTIFWLNGGPGCSSMDGALMEIGPLRINSKNEVIYNEGAWSLLADLVFVDQPGGTGFSYTDSYDRELNEVSFDFLKFMEEYFKTFPNDLNNDIYLAGESYAGQYIPYIAEFILNRNANRKSDEKMYNLKGLLIGNGWISPNEQSLSYLPFAIEAGLIASNDENMPALLKQQEKCQNYLNHKNDPKEHDNEFSSSVCEGILDSILKFTLDDKAPEDQRCINMYDYRLRDSFPSCGMNWPPDLSYVTPFLRNDKVQKNLNLKKKVEWSECDSKVSRFLRNEKSKPAVTLLPELLTQIPIMLFNGNKDIICNYIGTEIFISNLHWSGFTGFTDDALTDNWIYNNNEVGTVKHERNLTFINVYESSHMVPFDLPDVSRSLIDIMTGNFQNAYNNVTNQSLIVTPVYINSSIIDDDGAKDSNSSAGSSLLSLTTLLQLVIILIIVWGVIVIYKSNKISISATTKPSSILTKTSQTSNASKTKSHKKKKSVQWADQLVNGSNNFDINNKNPSFYEPEFDDNSTLNPSSSNLNASTKTNSANTILSNVLSKLGYNANQYTLTNNYENIELGESHGEVGNEFLIDSDED